MGYIVAVSFLQSFRYWPVPKTGKLITRLTRDAGGGVPSLMCHRVDFVFLLLLSQLSDEEFSLCSDLQSPPLLAAISSSANSCSGAGEEKPGLDGLLPLRFLYCIIFKK